MSPNFQHGDYVVSFSCKYTRYRMNDVIVVRHPNFGTIIKRIADIDPKQRFLLAGDNPASTSSFKIGRITRPEIIGKLLWHIAAKEKS